MAALITICLVYALSLLPYHSVSYPYCTNSSLASKYKVPLKFCQYYQTVCDSDEDFKLQKQFEVLNISDPQCASLMQSILCAKCDPYSSELFNSEATPGIPILCESNLSANPYQSNDFCTRVWQTCGNISIYSSPFFVQEHGEAKPNLDPSKLIDAWNSNEDFCKAFGGSEEHDNTVCFNGKSSIFRGGKVPSPIKDICIEKIGSGSYTSMAGHPDGSDRAFFASKEGKIWLASIPEIGSNEILSIDESKPFLDISDRVLSQTRYGLLGMVFHRDFAENGRFFVSFNCDKLQHSGCSGRCSCNTDVNCDPANLMAGNGIMPCQYHNVIAEYNIKGVHDSFSNEVNPSEARRILTMGLPFHKGHAGQILFGPHDGYLYTPLSDGTPRDEPYNFSQNKKSLLGKILRFDVDKMPSEAEVNERNLWGNYSIPKDNPYMEDKDLSPEIWALGFHNPWRCSFDAERPSYFICGDAGQDMYEEVDLVTKGENYGWPIYEGPFLSRQSQTSKIKPIFPLMGYSHSQVRGNASSIIGGYFYRSKTDPCLYGRYLYADLYAESVWVGTELHKNSGNFTTVEVPYICAKDSPLVCNTVARSSVATIGFTFSFGEDNRKDIYILTSNGVYRVAHPSRCGFSCLKDHGSGSVGQGPRSSASSSSSCSFLAREQLLLLSHYFMFWVVYCLAGCHLTVSL